VLVVAHQRIGCTPRLVRDRFYTGVPTFNYDVAHDDSPFLMVEPDEPIETERIHAMLNGFQELERLVPTGC
jgi:hypothetical protein